MDRVTYSSDRVGPHLVMIRAHHGKDGWNEGQGPFIGEVKFVLNGDDRGRFEISDLAVDEDFQRRGIGRELVRRAERRIAREGGRMIYAIPGDEDAREFWNAVGYRDGETPDGSWGVVKKVR